MEDVEADVKETLSHALKTLGPKKLVEFLDSIPKKHTSAFFKSLQNLTSCYIGIDQHPDPKEARAVYFPVLTALNAFGKVYEFILNKDLGPWNRVSCGTLLSGLTPSGRYEEAFELVRMATVDPQQLDLTAEQGKELCLEFIKTLCKEGRFNKALETLEMIRNVSNRHDLEGIKTLVESLGERAG